MRSTLPRRFTLPTRGTRLHIVNEVLDFEKVETIPQPIEVVLMNLRRQGIGPQVDEHDFGILLEPQEDACILFRVVVLTTKERAREAIRRECAAGKGVCR